MDHGARQAAVESAPYPPTAMILHFLRCSRSEQFNAPIQALRWVDLAQRILERESDSGGGRLITDHRWIEARLAQARAACFMIQGRLRSAHKLYMAALRGFEAINDAVFAATVKRGLLFTLTQMGCQSEAVVLGLEALAVFRHWRLNREYLSTMNNLGLVALSRGRLDRAEAIFSRLRSAAAPDWKYYPLIFHNSVLVRIARGNPAEAVAELGEFIRLCRAADNRIEEARGLFMLGECMLLQNRPEEAILVLSDAKSKLAETQAGFDSALINIYIAKGLTQTGRASETLPLLQSSAEFFRGEGYVTALNELLDAWMATLARADADVRHPAEETFVFARYYRHCIPVPARRSMT